MEVIEEKENVAPRTSSDPLQHKGMSPSPRKKSGRKGRSKSIGPGALDEVETPKQSAKDRRKSLFAPATKSILSKNEESERAARRKSMMNRRVSFAPEATLHTWDIVEYAKDHTTSTDSAESTRRASSFNQSSSPGPSSDNAEEEADADLLTPEKGRKQRRSSGIPPMNFNNPDDVYSSSGVSESEESGSDDGDDAGSEGDTDTAMSLDVDDATIQSNAPSDNSTASSDGLEERLRQAAQMAGTRGIEYDEFGEMSMELAAEEITNAFKPWAQRLPNEPQGSAAQDQENINPFSPAFKAQVEEQQRMTDDEGEEDMSMDVTRAVGGIVDRRPSLVSSPLSDGDDTMELTQAVGKITGQKRRRSTTEAGSPSSIIGDSQPKRRRSSITRSSIGEETMDLTMAVGSIKNAGSPVKVERRRSMRNRRSSGAISQQEDASMDLTQAVGIIQSAKGSNQTGADDSFDGNEELSMELTTVLGGIRGGRPEPLQSRSSSGGSRPATPQKPQSPVRSAANITPTQQERFKDTPDLGAKQLLTPLFQQEVQRTQEKRNSSIKGNGKTRVSMSPLRSAEPPASEEPIWETLDIRVDSQGSPKAVQRQSPIADVVYPDLPALEQQSQTAEAKTPSPKVLRDHRAGQTTTLGPLEYRLEAPASAQAIQTQDFASPTKSTVRTPEKLELADQSKDLTASIKLLTTPRKEALKTATPKKQSAMKQKSPFRTSTPKTRDTLKGKEATTELPSPVRQLHEDLERIRESGGGDERIGLQDFLSSAGIRFMDLTTTKRRLTTAPTPSKAKGVSDNDEDVNLESSVVAAACTVPELELYQHACHELKRYIKEGKQMIAELEATTIRDQPPLIKVYTHASPSRKATLDARMRDMKTDARLRSKEAWYGWRSQLLNELLSGIGSIGEGLIKDDETLNALEETIHRFLPGLTAKHTALQREGENLEATVNAMPEAEKEELNSTRQGLSRVGAGLDIKRRVLAQLRQQAEEQDTATEHLQESKDEFTAAIQEANRVREACRGVSTSEIAVFKESVQRLEDTFGWSIASASSSPSTITMTYKSELQLFFHPGAFQQSSSSTDDTEKSNEAIRLSYVGDSETTILRFFLQLLRAILQGLPQCTTKIPDLLGLISNGWEIARTIAEAERRLNLETMTASRIISDEQLAIESTVLLPKVRTKVRVTISIQMGVGADLKLRYSVEPNVMVVYGEQYNEKNMTEYLRGQLNDCKGPSEWDGALRHMKEKLIARGAKGARK